MSEFQLAESAVASSRGGQQAQQRGNVEWYQAGAANYPTSTTDYSFDGQSGYISSSNNDFTDEAPLLEGWP